MEDTRGCTSTGMPSVPMSSQLVFPVTRTTMAWDEVVHMESLNRGRMRHHTCKRRHSGTHIRLMPRRLPVPSSIVSPDTRQPIQRLHPGAYA
jgi:hypothetical protein